MVADPFSTEALAHEINVVPMNFRKDYKPVPEQPGEFTEIHRVDLVKKGTNGESTPWSIKALEQEQMLWPHIKPSYERWLEGQEEPVDGTPLDVLPFIAPALVPHFKSLLIKTAEDLAAATDADLDRIGMGSRGFREKCRAYVANKAGDAKLADMLAARDAENAQLRSELDELKREVNALSPKTSAKK